LNIWNKRHQLRINSFKNYVITAASYHGIRKKQTLRSVPIQYVEDYEYTEDEAYTFNNFSAINQGETKIWQSEFDLKVDALLNELPKRCREIYTMSRKDNLSINEISTRLNISKRTVENQLTNALKHLRTSLKCLMVIILLVGI
jgi:RNA polymerase sigma-70 factor (ECF subfamily)